MSATSPPPVILAIGGSDSCAGAGIQADLKAIHEAQCYALTVVTGIVAESPNQVRAWEPTSSHLVREQLAALFSSYPIAAVKVGLLFSPEIVKIVAETLLENTPSLPIIIDPVGAASAGCDFGGQTLRDALSDNLFQLATLVTPNLPEARQFCYSTTEEVSCLAQSFHEQYQCAVLVKGGHDTSTSSHASDHLITQEGRHIAYTSPRLDVPDYHGTGCTLASSITSYLALGNSLEHAIEYARYHLQQKMHHGYSWKCSPSDNSTHALGCNISNNN